MERRRQLTDLPYLDIRKQMLPRLAPSTSVDALTMCMMVPAQNHLHASFSLSHSTGAFSCYLMLSLSHTPTLLGSPEQACHLVFTLIP